MLKAVDGDIARLLQAAEYLRGAAMRETCVGLEKLTWHRAINKL
jgi:hypothetical protein